MKFLILIDWNVTPYLYFFDYRVSVRERRGAVVKGVEHISTIVPVNIWMARVGVPLVLLVEIWICKNSTINT